MPRPRRTAVHENRKREHAAFALPVFGALLLLPPISMVFQIPQRVFGVPVEVVYLFSVWIVLIAGSVVASRLLPRPERRQPETGAPGAE